MEGFFIRQYDAKEQAELRVRVKIPGSWFGGLTAGEARQDYWCEAFAHEDAHHFPKKGSRKAMTCAGIRFVSGDDAAEDPNSGRFIMPIEEWNRYRHYTYQGDREAEVPYIRNVTAAATTAPSSASEQASSRPPIYEEFVFVSASTHLKQPKDGGQKVSVPSEFWRCKNTSGKCKHRLPIKIVAKATGKLFGHLKICNPIAHAKIKIAAGADVDANGDVISPVSFAEMLPSHVEFTIMLVMEWDHMWRCRSKHRQEWAKSLKRGASVPHRATVLKIMRVIHGLMGIKLDKMLELMRDTLGEPYAGAQDDIWSMKNCREVRRSPPRPLGMLKAYVLPFATFRLRMRRARRSLTFEHPRRPRAPCPPSPPICVLHSSPRPTAPTLAVIWVLAPLTDHQGGAAAV